MKRFLIVHFYSNGDCLYTTTLAKQLKNDFPGCHITWAIAPFCASIIQNNPFVDTVWKVDYVKDRKIETFRNNRDKFFSEAQVQNFDRIFFTQIIEENFKYYDGLVRSSIYSAFRYPVTVPVQPVLQLLEYEKINVEKFVSKNNIQKEDFIILFECAPQSGQLNMNIERATVIAKKLIADDSKVKVILSSQISFSASNEAIIDGSVLTLRETAYVTNYCSLLIGCSSGITWGGTSTAAKSIPSIQLLDRNAYIFNSPVLDHKRVHLPVDKWIEMYDFDDRQIQDCVSCIIHQGVLVAKNRFGQKSVQTFRLYRGIIHTFIQQGRFSSILFFIKNNLRIHGFNLRMMLGISKGIVFFPVQYFLNRFNKKS